MPEVPSNMQEGLAHLELEAREVPAPVTSRDRRTSSISTMSSPQTPYGEQPFSNQSQYTQFVLQPAIQLNTIKD